MQSSFITSTKAAFHVMLKHRVFQFRCYNVICISPTLSTTDIKYEYSNRTLCVRTRENVTDVLPSSEPERALFQGFRRRYLACSSLTLISCVSVSKYALPLSYSYKQFFIMPSRFVSVVQNYTELVKQRHCLIC